MIEEAQIKVAFLELVPFIPVSEERRHVSATSGRRRFLLNNGCDANIHSCPFSLASFSTFLGHIYFSFAFSPPLRGLFLQSI